MTCFGRRGGHQILLKINKTALSSAKSFEFEIHPYRGQITYNSKIVIDNLFHEHNTSRYVQASMGKIRNVTSYVLPSTELTQVNISISVYILCYCISYYYNFDSILFIYFNTPNGNVIRVKIIGL